MPAHHRAARYLDPTIGRFGAVDTVIPNAPAAQGYNAYAYVAGNPTTWVDPTGHTTTVQRALLLAPVTIVLASGTLQVLAAGITGAFSAIICALQDWCRNAAMAVAGAVGGTIADPPRPPAPPPPPCIFTGSCGTPPGGGGGGSGGGNPPTTGNPPTVENPPTTSTGVRTGNNGTREPGTGSGTQGDAIPGRG